MSGILREANYDNDESNENVHNDLSEIDEENSMVIEEGGSEEDSNIVDENQPGPSGKPAFKQRKRKLPKDPAAPKRPLSAYLLWAGEKRAGIREELGNISTTMMMKEIGKRWNQEDPAVKEKYENQAKMEMVQYRKEMESYVPSEEYLSKLAEAKSKMKPTKIKDPNAPKKPHSAYGLWSDYMRVKLKEEFGSIPFAQMAGELGRRWATVDDATKQRYAELAMQEKEKYQEKMKSYTPSKEYMAKLASFEMNKSSSKKAKDPNAPKKPLSSYMLWSKDARQGIIVELGNLSVGAISKELSKRWTSLDQETKAKYETMATEERERYAEALKAYYNR